jgi:hypothetical protein
MTAPNSTTIYGISEYGTSLYGAGLPSGYIVDPFTATPFNYQVINLAWVQCSNPIVEFRLLRNRYGYPVDENDGEVLLDETAWPGNAYVDTDVVPGSYHYYGIYLLVAQGNLFTWIRAGLTACLIQEDLSSDNWLYLLVPEVLRNINQFELTADAVGDFFLFQFMEVIGWGLDYLKTQYNLALQMNNPRVIPLDDLMNLAGTIGYDFEPEVQAGVMRKGIANAAHVSTERGTMLGITNEVNIITGWEIVPTLGYNQMLEDDHGFFISPVDNYPAWNNTVSYNTGEHVTYNNFVYTANITSLNHSPTGTSGGNTWWNSVVDADNTTTLANPATNGINTFEARYTSASGQVATANSCREGVGIQDPLIPANYNRCGVRVYNQGGSARTCELKSIARLPSDIASLSADPDPQQVILDGAPISYLLPQNAWQGNTEIETNAIVSYNGQPFIALRPSTNSQPPVNTNLATNEWQPIGLDRRLALMMSGYVSQSLSTGTNYQCAVTPYVVWYDQWGRYISQVFARTPSSVTPGQPDKLYFDSFTNGLGTSINGTSPDIGAATWTVETGAMVTSAFNTGSIVAPVTQGQRSYAVMTGTQANCQVGVTFVSAPDSGNSQAIVFRWSNDTNYWRADQNTLTKKVAGVFTIVAHHSTPFSPGDRMNITMNGSVITVFRNGVQVSTVTDAFNSTQTAHGILYEPTTLTNYPTMMRQSSSTRKRTTRAPRSTNKRKMEPGFGQGAQGSVDVPERMPRTTRRKPPVKKTGKEFSAPPPSVIIPADIPQVIRQPRTRKSPRTRRGKEQQ